jgi:hypothetical protein
VDIADELSRRAAALLVAQGPTCAVGRLRQAALLAAPERPAAYIDLCSIMRLRARPVAAARWLIRARRIAPGHMRALELLADTLSDLRSPTAIPARRAIVATQPERARSYALLGSALTFLDRAMDAISPLCRAVAVDPNDAVGWTNLGATQRMTGALADADTALRHALVLTPGDRRVAWNFGRVRLTHGDLVRGWRHYDAGLDLPNARPLRRPPPARFWRGEPLDGRTILVMGEQGIGDEMLFATCLPELIARSGACSIEIEPRLVPLFKRSFPAACVRSHGEATGDTGPYDFVTPIASLPRWLRRSHADFPRSSDVLQADPARVAYWRDALAERGPGPWIGLGWRSGLMRPERLWYYPDAVDWTPLLRTPGASFISLQHGNVAAELAEFKQSAGRAPILLAGLEPSGDIDDLAAAMMALDLVISVGTATRILASALGRPTWYVGPWPNWMFLGRETCPFFPNERAYHRRREVPWRAVIEHMTADLGSWLSAAQASRGQSPA